jgi:uncharacterized DUF497 family protein
MFEFRWNGWNLEHVRKHGLEPADAEFVVRHARRPYPEPVEDEKWRVRGQTQDGAYIQVIYIFSPEDVVYVIHARPLTDREKKALRRRRR